MLFRSHGSDERIYQPRDADPDLDRPDPSCREVYDDWGGQQSDLCRHDYREQGSMLGEQLDVYFDERIQ